MNFVRGKSAGCGLGLRPKHYPQILSEWPTVDWFEAISENFMDSGGRPIHVLEQVRSRYPVALHGVALSIGSVDPLDLSYLKKLKTLVDRIDPFIVSDHLCWSGAHGNPLHDLLPLPFTEESLIHIVKRVDQVQEYLGRPILLENVSSYVTYKHSEMTEWEFITKIAKRSGCGILLDVNNVYVNAVNHQFSASEYIQSIPSDLIGQIHLAGHTDMGEFLFDTHSAPVIDPVWKLYEETLARHGQISTLIEWDENIPSFDRLQEERNLARKIYDRNNTEILRYAQDDNQCHAEAKPKHLALDSVVGRRISFPLSEVESKIKDRILSKNSAVAKSATTAKDAVIANPEGVKQSSEREIASLPSVARNDGVSSQNDNLPFLNPQGSASGAERMEVYANGYPARMLEALKETYETIYRILGENLFADLVDVYIQKFPSTHYNLNYAGQYLPEFLKVLPNHIESQFPFLRDLASLEWNCWKAFHAFDQKPFEASELAGIPIEDWERAKLTFQPSVSLLVTAWAVFELWKSKSREQISFDLESMRNRPEKILIGRRGDLVRCEPLDEYQFEILKSLIEGESLGSACEKIAEQFPKLEVESLPVANWFASWIQAGLIADCRIEQSI